MRVQSREQPERACSKFYFFWLRYGHRFNNTTFQEVAHNCGAFSHMLHRPRERSSVPAGWMTSGLPCTHPGSESKDSTVFRVPVKIEPAWWLASRTSGCPGPWRVSPVPPAEEEAAAQSGQVTLPGSQSSWAAELEPEPQASQLAFSTVPEPSLWTLRQALLSLDGDSLPYLSLHCL